MSQTQPKKGCTHQKQTCRTILHWLVTGLPGKGPSQNSAIRRFATAARLWTKSIIGAQNIGSFWATVCKMPYAIGPLSVLSCPVCLSICLSVTLVYCDQTVGWIKMPLGMEVGLDQATLC